VKRGHVGRGIREGRGQLPEQRVGAEATFDHLADQVAVLLQVAGRVGHADTSRDRHELGEIRDAGQADVDR
jgi:hypothetical protein